MGKFDTFMLIQAMQSKKREFFFSEQQKKEQIEKYWNAPPEIRVSLCYPETRYALLDDGRIEEFTECQNSVEALIVTIKPHSELYADSIYLGMGVIADVDSVIKELEKQLKEGGDF
jgi:hypothetical protein